MGGLQARELGEVGAELDGATGFPLPEPAVAGTPETGGLRGSQGASQPVPLGQGGPQPTRV